MMKPSKENAKPTTFKTLVCKIETLRKVSKQGRSAILVRLEKDEVGTVARLKEANSKKTLRGTDRQTVSWVLG